MWIPEKHDALGMFEATAHLMRKSGYLSGDKFGIHMWSCNDDGVQGHNYPTEQQPESQQIPEYAPRTDLARFHAETRVSKCS